MTPYQEAQLGQAMLRHRTLVEGWDGKTWKETRELSGIDAVVCRLLIKMDGGSMYEADLMDMDNAGRDAVKRMVSKGLVDVIGFKGGKGRLLMCTPASDEYLEANDTGQDWLF